jgi:hypothetical protein
MLSETDKRVVETIRMRLTTEQALQYLKDNEFPMSRASYFRHKKKVEERKLKRLYEIAKVGFQDQHLETIDQYEMGFKMMWQNVLKEQDPYKQNVMIKDILLLQPYLSAYYEATKLVFSVDNNNNNNNNQGYDSDDTVMVNNNDNEDKAEEYNDNRKF